jgi:hypothetical protein
MRRKNFNRLGFIVTLLLAPLYVSSQGPPSESPATPNSPGETPVGHWVAEHPSRTGVGSWWDFRPDGTLTMHIGAIVSSTIKRTADTITSPPVTVDGPPITVRYHIEGDTLHLISTNSPEQTLARIGPAPSATDPLLGKWRPIPPATPSADANVAAQEKLMSNAILAFFPDNTESVRIPFNTFEGTWNAAAHTFRINNQTEIYTFQRTGSRLSLGQPPDGHKTDTYLPDPIV